MMDFAPTFQLGHPIAFEAAARVAETDAGGHGPRLLRQLRLRGGGHRAEDRAGLSPAPAARRSACGWSGASAAITASASAACRSAASAATASSSARCCPMWTTCRTRTCPRENAFSTGQPEHGARAGRRAGEPGRAARRRHHRRGDGRARGGVHRRAGAARGLPEAPARDLRQARHPADLRRGDHRLRPPGHAISAPSGWA